MLETFQDPVAKVHPEGRLVLALQKGAHVPEVAKLAPAGLSGAGAGHAVTFAELPHRLAHRHPASLVVVESGQAGRPV